MKNKYAIRIFSALLAVMLCMTAFSASAFADGTEGNPSGEPVEAVEPEQTPEATVEETPEPEIPAETAAPEETAQPAAEPDYLIEFEVPEGWRNTSADVTVRITDKNNGGWAKVEIELDRDGSWTDMTEAFTAAYTEKQKYEIPVAVCDNCLLTVRVTAPDGGEHTNSIR